MKWREHITVDPEICHGRACITGTRVLVSVVLDNVAAGPSPEEIVRSYPSITRDSVRAAMCYAAELARERVVAFPGRNAFRNRWHGSPPLTAVSTRRNHNAASRPNRVYPKTARARDGDQRSGSPPGNRQSARPQYLRRSSVQSDQAHRDAELDWEALRETAKLRDSIEAAWTSLRNEPHVDLVGLIARETERRAHKLPDRDMVETFIRGGFRFPEGPSPSPAAVPTPAQKVPERKRTSSSRAKSWTYRGERRSEKNASDMYQNVISQFYRDFGGVTFYQNLQQRIAKRKTKHIAESPGDAGSRAETVRPLPGGWHLNTNVPNSVKIQHLRSACDVAGIVYGRDLVIES